MLTPLMELKSQARGVMQGTRTLEKRGDRRRRDKMLSFWGTVLSFCIPPVMLIGVIWNPTGVEGGALMALLAVLVLARLGIALAKMGTIHRRDRRRVPDTVLEQEAAWKSERPFQSLHAP